MKKFTLLLVVTCLALLGMSALADMSTVQIATDTATLGRGADSMMTNCRSCHSLKYVRYRDLTSIGIPKPKIDEWRGSESVDNPMLAVLADKDALQSFGIVPPDLSLITKARDGGMNYLYAYLLGYHNTSNGSVDNLIYPGTKMPDALGISSATTAAQLVDIHGKARDVTSFLAWAADPHAKERIRMGYYVLAYLVLLTSLLYLVKRMVWARLSTSDDHLTSWKK